MFLYFVIFAFCSIVLSLVLSFVYDFVRIWLYIEELESRTRRLGKGKDVSRYLELYKGKLMGSDEEFFARVKEKKEELNDFNGGVLHNAPKIAIELYSESALFLGGPAAVVEQLAHPYVAFGVSSHSYLMSDDGIRKRFYRTFEFMFGIFYGDWDRVMSCVKTVRKLHAKVNGEITEDLEGGLYKKGDRFDALSISAAFWVFATLTYNRVLCYEIFKGRLTKQQKDDFYAFERSCAVYWDIPEDAIPKNWEEFEHYVCSVFYSPILAPSKPAVNYIQILLKPSYFDFPGLSASKLCAMMITPEPLRKYMKLERSARDFFYGLSFAAFASSVYRLLPKRLRFLTRFIEREHRNGGGKELDWLEKLGQSIGAYIVDKTCNKRN